MAWEDVLCDTVLNASHSERGAKELLLTTDVKDSSFWNPDFDDGSGSSSIVEGPFAGSEAIQMVGTTGPTQDAIIWTTGGGPYTFAADGAPMMWSCDVWVNSANIDWLELSAVLRDGTNSLWTNIDFHVGAGGALTYFLYNFNVTASPPPTTDVTLIGYTYYALGNGWWRVEFAFTANRAGTYEAQMSMWMQTFNVSESFTMRFSRPSVLRLSQATLEDILGKNLNASFYQLAGGTCDYPPVGRVRSGEVYDFGNLTGTEVMPPANKVETGYGFGEDGTEFTGTLNPGGGGGGGTFTRRR